MDFLGKTRKKQHTSGLVDRHGIRTTSFFLEDLTLKLMPSFETFTISCVKQFVRKNGKDVEKEEKILQKCNSKKCIYPQKHGKHGRTWHYKKIWQIRIAWCVFTLRRQEEMYTHKLQCTSFPLPSALLFVSVDFDFYNFGYIFSFLWSKETRKEENETGQTYGEQLKKEWWLLFRAQMNNENMRLSVMSWKDTTTYGEV